MIKVFVMLIVFNAPYGDKVELGYFDSYQECMEESEKITQRYSYHEKRIVKGKERVVMIPSVDAYCLDRKLNVVTSPKLVP